MAKAILKPLFRLLIGLMSLAALMYLLAFGPIPAGTTVSRNLEYGFDATPLFYTEVDEIYDYGRAVQRLIIDNR